MNLSPAQIELARHALGLDSQNVSYRNRYIAGHSHDRYQDWLAMVEQGAAVRYHGKGQPYGGADLFMLTRAGASAVLRKGENLCREDFPAGPLPRLADRMTQEDGR